MTKMEMINTMLTCSNIEEKDRIKIVKRAMKKDKISISLIYYGYCTRENVNDDLMFINILAQ